MATAKTKKTAKKSSKAKAAEAKTAKAAVQTKTVEVEQKTGLRSFFACKYDASENILTVFKRPQLYGAILGEVIGTMMLTILMLTLGIGQPIYIFLGMVAITMAVYTISGAYLNPIVTVGAMATRRISAIRGVLYIVSQIVGAWLGLVIVSAFVKGSGSEVELPTMAEVGEGKFISFVMIEAMAAAVFAFFYARAYAFRKKTVNYAIVVAGGFTLAALFAYIISYSFFSLQNNFIINPAIAIMYQIFPTSGGDLSEIFGAICSALAIYMIFPMIAGVIGFFLADLTACLSGERDGCKGDCCCNK